MYTLADVAPYLDQIVTLSNWKWIQCRDKLILDLLTTFHGDEYLAYVHELSPSTTYKVRKELLDVIQNNRRSLLSRNLDPVAMRLHLKQRWPMARSLREIPIEVTPPAPVETIDEPYQSPFPVAEELRPDF